MLCRGGLQLLGEGIIVQHNQGQTCVARHSGRARCTGTVARNVAQIPALLLSGHEILGSLCFNPSICKMWIKMLMSRAVVSTKQCRKHLQQHSTQGLSVDARY